MAVIVTVLMAGFCSGVLASVLGVGGAVITTPLIRALGASPIAAVGSTVPAILPGAVSGSLRYQREGYIMWPLALTCGLSGMAFAVAGGWIADIVDARYLMVFTAVLVMWSGASLLRERRRALLTTDDLEVAVAPGEAEPPGPVDTPAARPGLHPAAVGLGMVAGFLAGLLGVGGGIVLTPGLSLGLKLPMKHAIATSLVAVSMMSVTSLITHLYLGHIDWRFALPLAIGIVPGARVGARFTVGASEQQVRLVAGVLLIAIATVYLVSELAALG